MRYLDQITTAFALTLLLSLTSACGGVGGVEGAETESEDALEIGPVLPLSRKIVYSVSGGSIHVRDSVSGDDDVLGVSGRYPALSPDRQKIAFASGGRIRVVDVDGTNNVALTANGPYTRPAWSPDGTMITFASVGTAGWAADIFVINADGTDLRQLTDNSSLWLFGPKFLKNNMVTFQVGLTGQGYYGLLSTSADMQAPPYFSISGLDGAGDVDPAKNGARLVYTNHDGSCGNSAIMIVDVSYDNFFGLPVLSNATELYCNGANHRDASHPSFGDAGVIGFVRGNGTGLSWAGRDIMTIHRSGSNLTNHIGYSSSIDMSIR